MSRLSRALGIVLAGAVLLAGCKHEKNEPPAEPPIFTFTVYPSSQYLAELTDLTRRAQGVLRPDEPARPSAIYDTDAPLDTVASFYARSYGYTSVAADGSNNLSAAKPPAYYRTGELAQDVKSVQPILQKLNLSVDLAKAVGPYRAVEIDARPNRPHVTIQRPYFDVTKSKVIDRTMILMAR